MSDRHRTITSISALHTLAYRPRFIFAPNGHVRAKSALTGTIGIRFVRYCCSHAKILGEKKGSRFYQPLRRRHLYRHYFKIPPTTLNNPNAPFVEAVAISSSSRICHLNCLYDSRRLYPLYWHCTQGGAIISRHSLSPEWPNDCYYSETASPPTQPKNENTNAKQDGAGQLQKECIDLEKCKGYCSSAEH